MRGSLKLFTWFGIPVHLHWTFGLIFVYAAWIGYENNYGVSGTIWLMGLFMLLFLCVVLHEYGHSLTARRYGVETKDIILTPIGGIARLERMPEKPIQEFLVAIAGPMVNVVIAILLFVLSMLVFKGQHWERFQWFLQNQTTVFSEDSFRLSILIYYLPVLVAINIVLVVFNMIPAFPMDGGRIFRALLAMRIGRVRATKWASYLGQIIAVLFIVFGLWQNEFGLALIGLFVFTTARSENSMVQLDAMLQRFTAKDLVRRNFTRLTVADWMQTPIELLRQGLERHFLVFDLKDELAGALEEDDIVAAMKRRDFSAEIAKYMQKVELVHISEPLQNIYHYLRQRGHSILGVMDGGELVGVIDEEGLQHFLRLQTSSGT